MIEDDTELGEILTHFLANFGIEVTSVDDPYIGLSELDIGEYELLILDLTLPGIDGLELLPKIREKSNIPIIISSARDDITDKVLGLERGADDYLPKPYNPRELEARIKSLLRRVVKKEEPPTNKLFDLSEDERSIHFQGQLLQLTAAEFDILSSLIIKQGGVVSRDTIIYNSPHIDDESLPKNIDVMVSRIRTKLQQIDPDSRHIKSVRGIGYQLLT
jgi:two-component system OmpR family response regulator